MKNKIIKFRSVEGVTGLKQIRGPGKDSERQRNERYVCFKAGLSILGGGGCPSTEGTHVHKYNDTQFSWEIMSFYPKAHSLLHSSLRTNFNHTC